jgi:4,5-DOPA dioxygenase extradiol
MNALEHNRYTQAWSEFGAAVPRPRAILAISAHWYINATAVTAMARPKTIHDFYGFPDELFAVEYPAPGDPELAAEIAEVVAPTWVGMDHDSWGIDHGTWSVLVHAFPDADIPVVQLAINALEPLEYHLELGRALAPLRDRGVLIVGSGNVVHNLRRVEWSQPDRGFDWAERFDRTVRHILERDPAQLVGVAADADYPLAVPTPDHFLPLLYVAGLAAADGTVADAFVGGCAMGSISMTSFSVGMAELHPGGRGGPPALPTDVPPDDTNI